MQASRPVNLIALAMPLVVAAAVGVVVVLVPTELSLLAILGGLAVVLILALRAAIGRAPSKPEESARTVSPRLETPDVFERGTAAVGESALRTASRVAYIVGLALMGIQLFRPALGFTVSDLFFLLATAGAGTVLVRERTSAQSIFPPLLVVGAGLFAVGALVSTMGAASPGDSLAQLTKFLFVIFGWFGAGVVLLNRPRHITTAAAAWVATVAINGVAALVQFGFGNVIPGATAAWGRMAGLTDHFNDLGGSSGLVLPTAIMLAVIARGRTAVLAWTATGLIAAGLLLSGSVGGVVAGIAGCMAVIATGRVNIGRKAMITLGIGVSALLIGTLILTALGVQTPLARVDVAAGAGGTFASRVQTYEQALWSISLDPIVGTGLSQGPTRTGYDVHSLILGAWYQTGIVGLAGMFLIVVAGSAASISAARRHRRPPFSMLVAGIVGSYAGFLVLGLAQPLLIQRYAWVPLALLLALSVQLRGRGRPSGQPGGNPNA